MDGLIVALAIAGNIGAAHPAALDTRTSATITAPQTIRQIVERRDIVPDRELAVGLQRPGILGQPYTTRFRPRHVKSAKLRAAVAGAGLGLLAGALIGYGVNNRDGCDMCGLAGLAIGAPIGGALGGVLGVKLF